MKWSGNKAVTLSVKAMRLLKQRPHAMYLGWVRKEAARPGAELPTSEKEWERRGNETSPVRETEAGLSTGHLCGHLQGGCTLSAFLSHTLERQTVAQRHRERCPAQMLQCSRHPCLSST